MVLDPEVGKNCFYLHFAKKKKLKQNHMFRLSTHATRHPGIYYQFFYLFNCLYFYCVLSYSIGYYYFVSNYRYLCNSKWKHSIFTLSARYRHVLFGCTFLLFWLLSVPLSRPRESPVTTEYISTSTANVLAEMPSAGFCYFGNLGLCIYLWIKWCF